MVTMLADSFLHTFDPFAIEFPASWRALPFVPDGIRWYGLSYITGFLIGWWITWRLARTNRCVIPVKAVGDFMTMIILGVIIGGRLGYAIFYDPHLLWGFTSSLPFWDLLAINKGGMASHGGMAGVCAACLLYARRTRLDALGLCDVAAFICPPGLFLGRLANFINGELLGRPIPNQTNPPWWSVKFPQEINLQEFANDPASVAALDQLRSLFSNGDLLPDQAFHEQIIRAVQSGDQKIIAALEPLLTARYPSQLIQAFAEGIVLMVVLAWIWRKQRKPGVTGSWFLIAYGALRIATERFRMPDEGVALLLGLSRGQLLSIGLILAGVICLRICLWRETQSMFGLSKPRT